MSRVDENVAPAQENVPQFAIQRLYIKDSSFEAPNSPALFLKEWRPEVDLSLDNKANLLDDSAREVVLTVTVTVKVGDQIAFLVEVKQAGIFTVQGFTDEQLEHMLGSFCPNILYPYAREAVTDLVMRGGFPQLYLSPINFDLLLEQHKKQKKDGQIVQ